VPGRGPIAILPAGLAGALLLMGVALGAFPQQAPNDPNYAPAEAGGAACAQHSVNQEERGLFGFMPACAPNAADPENAAGMSVDAAWRKYSTGSPKTVIAYVEAGINWRDQPKELADKVYLNPGELPRPTTPKHGRKVCSAAALCAADFADTKDSNHNGVVDPEDIIVRYSDGADQDHNGYTDDISGWDFYDDQNDPATVDSHYDHAQSQMRLAAAQTNNDTGDAGICPKCMLMPIKAGAEALDRTDDLAQAWLYASDMHAGVIISESADLGYSSFMRQAAERVWRRGTVVVQSSNDFDSTDHQGGMFWPHVIPGNGLVANTAGLDAAPNSAAAVNAMTTTYRARSGESSWGTHNMFSGATTGGSTSQSDPTIAGVLALALSYGREAAHRGLIRGALSGPEAVQLLRATASDVNDPNSNWPSRPGWDTQFGYGRPNALRALRAIHDNRIPPVGWISSPRWYSLYDPTKQTRVPVTGRVEAPRANRYRWKLQFAPGADPSPKQFMTAGHGSGVRPLRGRLGTLDLRKVPRSFWSRAMKISKTKSLETNERYTVTIRLRVTDSHGRVGEDRRTIAVTHDPTWAKGFPKRIGAGGEEPPALVDLQGRGHMAIVFGDSDGIVRALDGKTGRELPGWPVHTLPTRVTKAHRGIDPGDEPVVTGMATGDLFHNGHIDVVATSTTGRVYVWNARGHLMKGWPKRIDAGVRKPRIPRPALAHTRLPVMGATAPPVLADLNSDGKLEIVQAGWDGRIHVWHPNGRRMKGWPVRVHLPKGYSPPGGYSTVLDHKIDLPPAIGDIDGDGKPELVVRSQYTDITGDGLQPAPRTHLFAYEANGKPVAGWPVAVQGIIGYYGSAQEFITEGTSIPSLADIDGDGADEIAVSPGIFSPVTVLRGDGSTDLTYGPVPGATLALFANPTVASLTNVLGGNLPEDTPVSFTTSGAFGRFGPGRQLTYAEPGSGAASVAGSLLLTGSGININNYTRAYNAASGSTLPGFPAKLQGLDFLSGATIADVSGDGSPELLLGGDSSAVHAYTSSGTQAPKFPKFDTGWSLFAPVPGDVDGNGKTDLSATTREGYLFVWRTKGEPAANDQWWNYRHDERNTSAYGTDTRPPGVLRRAHLKRSGTKLRFEAPGDDWYAGKAKRYRITYGRPCGPGKPKHRSVSATVSAGHRQTLHVPKGKAIFAVQAVDDDRNVGRRWVSHVAYSCPAVPA
jgi:FG-GAP-like repeat/Subtilase family